MMKMLIKLNKDKVKELNLEYYIELTLEDAFEGCKVIKEHQPDGAIIYAGNPEYPNYLDTFMTAFSTLKNDEDFISVCEKWLLYTNNDDTSDMFFEEDVLKTVRLK